MQYGSVVQDCMHIVVPAPIDNCKQKEKGKIDSNKFVLILDGYNHHQQKTHKHKPQKHRNTEPQNHRNNPTPTTYHP